jgi:hypothetical protein
MPSKNRNQVAQSEPEPQPIIDPPPSAQRTTKQALLLELLRKPRGASLVELTSATGWLPHTARAALTGLRKRGQDVRRERVDGVSRYSVGTNGE